MDINKSIKVSLKGTDAAKALAAYRKARTIKGDANKVMTDAANRLKAVLAAEGAGVLTNGNGVVQALYRQDRPSQSIDLSAVQATRPDLYAALSEAGLITNTARVSFIVKD